jgi:LysR family transcriptional regulator (chromosome initiation inhibitor)
LYYAVRRLSAHQTAGKHVWTTAAGANRTAASHRTGQKLLALLRQVELLEEEWLGDEQTGSTPLLLSLAVNADSLATWLLPALSSVLSDSPIRLNLQVEDETRTQERLRRGEVVGAVSIQPQALPSCLVDQLGALDYLFVASKEFAQRYFPNG